MTTPDEHLATLRSMLRSEVVDGKYYRKRIRKDIKNDAYRQYARECEKNASALQWILDQNAYGVTSDEIVG